MASDDLPLEPAILSDRLAELQGRNVLLRGPPMTGKGPLVQGTLAVADTGLLIATTRSPARRDSDPVLDAADVTVVDCTPGECEGSGVTSVGSPGDLTGIAMAASKFVTRAATPVVAVDSVSTLLMYADTAPVFRFLSVLTGHVRQAGGTGLYTIDTGSHPPAKLSTLAQLFDDTLDLSHDVEDPLTPSEDEAPRIER